MLDPTSITISEKTTTVLLEITLFLRALFFTGSGKIAKRTKTTRLTRGKDIA
jgi:hypothetical protein